MGSIRYYQAYLSIACTGPAYSPKVRYLPRVEIARGAADIKLTTADIDYFEGFWQKNHYDGGQEKIHKRLQDPTNVEFKNAVQDIDNWFSNKCADEKFDGGEITIAFAGHGREGSGNLVLKDIDVNIETLISIILSLKKTDTKIKVSLLLDSCYSGIFLIEFFRYVMLKQKNNIHMDYLAAAALHDEVAKESAQFGHGFFTYCFSCRPDNIGTHTATAVQADNSIGPSLSIASGALGCSILTQGTQNPIIIEEPVYKASCLGEKFDLIDDEGNLRDTNIVVSQIENLRDRLRYSLRMLSPDISYPTKALSLDKIREYIDTTYDSITKHDGKDFLS